MADVVGPIEIDLPVPNGRERDKRADYRRFLERGGIVGRRRVDFSSAGRRLGAYRPIKIRVVTFSYVRS